MSETTLTLLDKAVLSAIERAYESYHNGFSIHEPSITARQVRDMLQPFPGGAWWAAKETSMVRASLNKLVRHGLIEKSLGSIARRAPYKGQYPYKEMLCYAPRN